MLRGPVGPPVKEWESKVWRPSSDLLRHGPPRSEPSLCSVLADGLPARPEALVLTGHLLGVLRELQGVEELLDLAVKDIVEVIDR